MHRNGTCVNGTSLCAPPATSSGAGLAVGLTLFFLLLIVAALIAYKFQSKIMSMIQSRHRRNTKKEDHVESAEAAPEHYISLSREQSAEQAPIYENLATQNTGYNRRSVNRSRSPPEPDENLYLQCESADDAIYSNDPACSLSIMPQDEDVYIMPDS